MGAKALDQWDKDPGRPKLDWFNRKTLLLFLGCAGSSLLCTGCLIAVTEGYSLLQCTSFSLQCLLLLWSMGSRCMGSTGCSWWALEHGLSSCGMKA